MHTPDGNAGRQVGDRSCWILGTDVEHLDMAGGMRRERKMTILPFAQCHIEQVSGLFLTLLSHYCW